LELGRNIERRISEMATIKKESTYIVETDPKGERVKTPLAAPPPLFSRRVMGPSAVFTALAIGSGELLFWPSLSLPYGAGVLWIALVAVAIQYVMDIEIGRYSLATGESVVVGATKMWSGWGWILLLGTVVPWLWPGWARAGSQLISTVYGLPEKPISIASLVLCGILLAAPKSVYKLVERLQAVLLVFIIGGVLILSVLAVQSASTVMPFWSSLFRGEGIGSLLSRMFGAQSSDFLALLGGFVFAGAGGILNLGYGLLLCEKQFGMGRYAKKVVGLRHSFGLETADAARPELDSSAETKSRWSRWMSLARREHLLLFVLGNTFTIIFISLIFFSLMGRQPGAQGMAFLQSAATSVKAAIGGGASFLFVAVGYVIFFTSELGIIDVTSRLAAGITHTTLKPRRLSASGVYHLFVWGEILIGIALTLFDPRQPFWFLVTTGVLNTLVMAIYAALVLMLNRRTLPETARPPRVIDLFLGIAAVIYFAFFVLTFWRI
jgi:hypothetical protein